MQTKRAKGDFPSPSSFQGSSVRALFSEQLMLLDNLIFFTEGSEFSHHCGQPDR